MPTIINIETSTDICSVALSSEGATLEHFEAFDGHSHATMLSGFIKECLDHLDRQQMRLDAVAVSIGPGSYTGLRIGLSEAKGLAYAKDVPLIGVDTLELLAVSAMFRVDDVDPDALFVPMIDARRMEVYTGVYTLALETLVKPTPLIVEPDSYDRWLEQAPQALFFGNGAAKAMPLLTDQGIARRELAAKVRFIPDIVTLASDMPALADRAFRAGRFLDLAYSTPSYLKDFQATKPKRLF